jgi:hypothetical protein
MHTLSIAIAPPFAGLRRFPDGRGFKQWTGDDSKALMKASRLSLKILNHCNLTVFGSFIYLLYKVTSQQMLYVHSVHFLNSVI